MICQSLIIIFNQQLSLSGKEMSIQSRKYLNLMIIFVLQLLLVSTQINNLQVQSKINTSLSVPLLATLPANATGNAPTQQNITNGNFTSIKSELTMTKEAIQTKIKELLNRQYQLKIQQQLIASQLVDLNNSLAIVDKMGSLTAKNQSVNPKFNFSWDTLTPYANKFKVLGKKATRISLDNQTYQITSFQTLPKTGVYSVTFQVDNVSKSPLIFGITTSTRKRLPSSGDINQKQSIGYTSWDGGLGNIFVQGQYFTLLQQDFGTVVGGEIQMTIDLNEWALKFNRKVNQQQKTPMYSSVPISDTFIGKSIYVFVSMYSFADAVEII